MADKKNARADTTAVRVALWRAIHIEADPPPHVLEDEIGLKLVAPEQGWRLRPDMNPQFTKRFRASVVARARFIEDLVEAQAAHGVDQYVILGAGLDTFAQRRKELASRLKVFEVDKPEAQAWKQQRLIELGLGIAEWLCFVPVDFEERGSWRKRLVDCGLKVARPAVVVSTGVSMYLTRQAIASTLREVSTFAPGSTFVMTFIPPIALMEPEERPGFEAAEKGARASGTPFLSLIAPDEMLALAKSSGFNKVQHVSGAHLTQRYFAGRTDGLRPGSEELLVATT